MTMPNFLMIGAAKSGSSALYRYIKQHPDIFMSQKKEPHFFSYVNREPNTAGPGDTINDGVTFLEPYQALFDDVTTEKAIGEASQTYLYLPEAAPAIHHYIPDAKLIAILRHPIDRAFSAYMHLVRDNRETATDFRHALKLEEERKQRNFGPLWHYTSGSHYAASIKRYQALFPAEQLHIIIYDDYKKNQLETIKGVFRFLEVDPDFTPDISFRVNVSGSRRSKSADSLMNRIFDQPNPIRAMSRKLIPEPVRFRFTSTLRNFNLEKSQLSPALRQELAPLFHDDILELQELIGRDLSHWLNG